MELELNEDQSFFVETTRRFLAAECGIAATRALEHDPLGYDPAVWRRGCELGWTSLLVAEEHGGGSLSPAGITDAVLVAEEVGRLVAPGPLVPVSVVADALSRRGTDPQRAAVLPGLLDGTAVATWTGPTPVAATPGPDGGLVLEGVVAPVEAGAQAAHLLVTVAGPDGAALVLVPADAPGVAVTPLDGIDLVRRFASVALADVVVADDAVIGGPDDVERALQVACTLQCAEVVGAVAHVLAMTVEYLGDRYSFGRPLSSYQALKHRIADDHVDLEAGLATATAAARAVAAGAPTAGELVSTAQAWIGDRATEVVQDCVQLHGGIGVTWEHDLHLYLRRITVDRLTYGTPEDHLDRLADLLLGEAS